MTSNAAPLKVQWLYLIVNIFKRTVEFKLILVCTKFINRNKLLSFKAGSSIATQFMYHFMQDIMTPLYRICGYLISSQSVRDNPQHILCKHHCAINELLVLLISISFYLSPRSPYSLRKGTSYLICDLNPCSDFAWKINPGRLNLLLHVIVPFIVLTVSYSRTLVYSIVP